jgi:hypothetical protein
MLAPSLLYPFGRDQSVFAYVAQVLQRGGLPYRDVWDLKPPGIYFLYRAMLDLTAQPSMTAVRVVDLAWACASGLALYMVGRRFAGVVAAAAAGVWYAAAYLRMEFWGMAQAESFAALPLIVALACWWRGWERRAPWLFVAAGVLGGVAATLKFTAALPLLVPLLVAAATRGAGEPGDAPGRPLLAAAALTAAGAAVPVVACVLWMRGTGCWEPYLEIQRGFVAGYTRLDVETLAVRGGGQTLAIVLRYAVPALLAAAGVVALRRAGRSREVGLVAGWLGAAVVAVWLQNKFYRYHWIAVLPPLCLLAAAGGEYAAQALRGRWRGARVAAVTLALPVLWGAWSNGREYVSAARRWSGSLSAAHYQARFGPPNGGDFSFVGDRMAAEYVRAIRTPERGLFVWGFEPLVYLLSGSRPPTRFIFAAPLVAPWAPAAWRAELMRDLRAEPPRTILVVTHDVYPWATGRNADSEALLKEFPELDAFIRSGYQFEQVIEDFVVYRRRTNDE